MNKEYKFDGENTKVKMDNGEKEVKTVDNVYDILTEENIIEFINNLKNEEENKRNNLINQIKSNNKYIILFSIFNIIGTLFTGIQLFSMITSHVVLDFIYLLFFIIVTGYSYIKTTKLMNMEYNLKDKQHQTESNIDYLNLKEKEAEKALETIKNNSIEMTKNENNSRKMDMRILKTIKEQYESFKIINKRGIDMTTDEPDWDIYTGLHNDSEVDIIKNKRQELVRRKK